MTPLRWVILAGYVIAALVTWLLWEDLASGWKTLGTAMAPLMAFFAALFALKLTVVLTAVGSFLLIFLQGFVGILIAVSKIGVIKGLLLPWLLAGIKWLHRQSQLVQKVVAAAFSKGQELADQCYQWWMRQNFVDRLLMLGFVAPLILVVALAVLLKRIVYLFLSEKAVEQLVQRITKAVVGHFHRIPLLGKLPVWIMARWREVAAARDAKLEALNSRDSEKTQGEG